MRVSNTYRSAATLCAILVLATSSKAAVTTIFSDDHENPTSTATAWFSNTDNDPTTPVVGQPWTVVEANQYNIQEVRFTQNLVNNSTVMWGPSGTGGQQYLHTFNGGGGGPVNIQNAAWVSLSLADQALVTANGNLHVGVEVFGLSGYDGWHSDLRLVGYDSAATVGTSPAFDVELPEGGNGVNGPVLYTNGTGSHAAGTLVNQVNVWQTLGIDVNFNTDTFSITLDGNPAVTGLTWAGGDLSQIQSLALTFGSSININNLRGGWDNLTLSVTEVPEPASATAALLVAGASVVMRRRSR